MDRKLKENGGFRKKEHVRQTKGNQETLRVKEKMEILSCDCTSLPGRVILEIFTTPKAQRGR